MGLGSEILSDFAWEIEQAQYYAEKIANEAEMGIWTTKDGRQIPVEEMTTSHITNTIAYLKRLDDEVYEPWIDVFEEELKRRT